MAHPSKLPRLVLAALLGWVSAQAGASFIVDNAVVATPQALSGTADTGKITATGKLSVAGSGNGNVAITVSGNGAIVDNSGTIEQTGTARTIDQNTNDRTLAVFNRAGGVMVSADADTFRVGRERVSVTLENAGTLRSLNASAGGNQAIDWNSIATGANRLDNLSTGLVESRAADAVRPGANGIVNNAGIIRALPVVEGAAPNRAPSGSDGIDAQSRSGVAVANTDSGLISGRHGITGGSSSAAIDIVISNAAKATIEGVDGSGVNIDNGGSFARISNHGLIEGRFDSATYDTGDGDGVDVDGRVELDNYGIIRGLDASSGSNPEGVSIGGGILRNYAGAEIVGDNRLANGALGQGLLADNSDGGSAFAATELANAGTIRGMQGFAVKLIGDFDDTIDNQAGGVLHGAGTAAAVQTGGGNDRLVNAGLVRGDGGKAIDLGDGDDRLTIQGGQARILGDIGGGAGRDEMILAIESGNAFSYDGIVSDFEAIQVQSGQANLTGTFGGILQVAAGATLAPGSRIGSLKTTDLALAAGAILDIGLDPENRAGEGTADQVTIVGQVDLGLADLMLALLSAPTPGQVFDILLNQGTAPIAGRFAQGSRVSADYEGERYWFGIDYAHNLRLIALSDTVPVPPSLWLLGLGLAALGFARRSRGGSPT